MNAPNTTELIVSSKFDKMSFAKMLRQLFPRGRAWEFPLDSESEIKVIGIVSKEAFGLLTITTGGVSVSPIGIVSAEAFGLPITNKQFISPTGIASAEVFGSPTVTNP